MACFLKIMTFKIPFTHTQTNTHIHTYMKHTQETFEIDQKAFQNSPKNWCLTVLDMFGESLTPLL